MRNALFFKSLGVIMLQKYIIKVALVFILEWLQNQSRSNRELSLFISDNTNLTPSTVDKMLALLTSDIAGFKAGGDA